MLRRGLCLMSKALTRYASSGRTKIGVDNDFIKQIYTCIDKGDKSKNWVKLFTDQTTDKVSANRALKNTMNPGVSSMILVLHF